jgi:hypothetical protein
MQDKFHKMFKLQSRIGDYELIKPGEWELIKVGKWLHGMLTAQRACRKSLTGCSQASGIMSSSKTASGSS